MPRWEPNGQDRLVRAALDLFTEQGYEETTVAEIADRAGLTKSTFFRHFSDKREVLFAGQDNLNQLFTDGIANAPASATPLQAVAAALEAVAEAFPEEKHHLAPQRRQAIACHPELRERSALKRAGFADAMTAALRRRRVPDPAATLAAEVGVLAFAMAHMLWADPDRDGAFADFARQALVELAAAAGTLF